MKKEWKDIYKIVRLIVLCEIIFAFIWRLKESEITCTHEEGICKMKAKSYNEEIMYYKGGAI